ncbi:MAG: APC family permease [Armatimonadota bacterium]
MLSTLRHILFGNPLPSWRAIHERLPVGLALPIFASDALSSVAYATEEILLLLVLAGASAIQQPIVVFISMAIVILLLMVATSYRQTIYAYPAGGGAYIVAKDNLGDRFALIAGSSLIIEYILTVAVSISSGVAAIISIHPDAAPYAIQMALGGVGLIMLANLRGVRESGALFALPTYVFILSLLILIGVGFYREFTVGLTAVPPTGAVIPEQLYTSVGWFLILRAFSSGCTAMTGTEAISTAVQAFRPPEAKNASKTLMIMVLILGVLFFGISVLAFRLHAMPIEFGKPAYETILSQIARTVFDGTSTPWLHQLIQYATAAILFLAANTSFAGFPRLASIMARDRFMPRQFYNVGDRLVFSNGILVLAILAGFLIYVFKANTSALIPLYAVGVFLSFTLSQTGMVRRFMRLKNDKWQIRSIISGIGAFTTGIVTIIIIITKLPTTGWHFGWPLFDDGRLDIHIPPGAWLVVLLTSIFVYTFYKIHSHYIRLGNQLRLTNDDVFEPMKSTLIVLTPSLHRGILPALEYAKGMSGDVRAVHIDTDPLDSQLLIERWEQWGGGIPLVILESEYRSIIGPLFKYLEEVKEERPDSLVTVVVPEFVPAKWWHKILHNQSGLLLKFMLLFRKGIVMTNIRYYLNE